MHLRLSSRLLLWTFVSLLPLPAFANEARQHDKAFFLRLAPGFGSFSTKADDGVDSVKFSGAAGAFDVAVGYVIKPNLALHASIGAWSTVNPKLTVNGQEFDTDDVTVGLTNVGAGVTYYLGESNTYLTATLGLASLNAEFNGDDAQTGGGVAFEVGAGKEWWVSKKLGLGVGAALNYHSVPDDDIDTSFKGTSFGIRMTATFN
jgi:hypothetical protein